jgi:predicted GIY-YIG superfamily endonuclease
MFIYVIGPEDGPQKIGITNNLKTRLMAIQTGNPDKLYVHHFEEVNPKRVRMLEKKIHSELNYKKLKGEWFNITKEDAVDYVIYFNIRYADDPLLGI